MRDVKTMTAALAVVMMATALSGCAGGGAKDQTTETAPADAAATPPAQDRDNPVPAAAEPENYDPATAAGAVKGIPDPGNTAPIEAVANYFAELPGFDLAPLGERGREKFLHRVNSELCTCGCKNDTLAWCLINDPKCPTVRGLVQSVYDEVKSGS